MVIHDREQDFASKNSPYECVFQQQPKLCDQQAQTVSLDFFIFPDIAAKRCNKDLNRKPTGAVYNQSALSRTLRQCAKMFFETTQLKGSATTP
jgi:hypothetical protein